MLMTDYFASCFVEIRLGTLGRHSWTVRYPYPSIEGMKVCTSDAQGHLDRLADLACPAPDPLRGQHILSRHSHGSQALNPDLVPPHTYVKLGLLTYIPFQLSRELSGAFVLSRTTPNSPQLGKL